MSTLLRPRPSSPNHPGTTSTHLLLEQMPLLRAAPHSWINVLRQFRSLISIATVFAILVTVAVFQTNVDLLNPLEDLSITAFRSTVAGAELDTSAIIESTRTAGLLAQLNRPVPRTALNPVQDAAGPLDAASRVDPATGLERYVVEQGDTVWGLAASRGLERTTIQWANPLLDDISHLSVGDVLMIPAVDGAMHRIVPGDTLSQLANVYGADINDIVSYGPNRLASSATQLRVGMDLMIPGGVKPLLPTASRGASINFNIKAPTGALPATGIFVKPLDRSHITQGYWDAHKAIDYSSRTGAPIKTLDHGTVAYATYGWNYGYGNMVVVDHGNGYTSLYAHLSTVYVRQGQAVRQGEVLGTLGSTGNSTGPHLHLELRLHGANVNPLGYVQQ
ncbi:MAG: peptidoglycan DD-metalloendopeptidase family protein [Caldilineaceae bacterium]|nr:peptidoglycan DD-metalloendopeptidase family protein [Caldilineaceae bacterium]